MMTITDYIVHQKVSEEHSKKSGKAVEPSICYGPTSPLLHHISLAGLEPRRRSSVCSKGLSYPGDAVAIYQYV